MASSQLGADLSDDEIDAVVAFLDSLTGDVPEVVCPILPAETEFTRRPTGEVLPD